jgi:hypothetical protein
MPKLSSIIDQVAADSKSHVGSLVILAIERVWIRAIEIMQTLSLSIILISKIWRVE